MAKKRVFKLSDVMDTSQYDREVLKGRDLLDVPLEFQAARFNHGRNGDYVVVTAIRLDTGDEILFSTGAMIIVEVCQRAERNRQFPFQAMMRVYPGEQMVRLVGIEEQ